MSDPREQRVRNRVRMDLPVRVRQIGPPRDLTEVTRTLDVSRNGVLFRTRQPYDLRSIVWVTMPFNSSAIAPEPEFPSTVVRVDRKPDGFTEVAVQFHNARSDYVPPVRSAEPKAPAKTTASERRGRSRVRMSLPILIQHGSEAEETITFDVSRGGVLFQTGRQYPVGQTVTIVMPYQREARAEGVAAKVVRVVQRENFRGVALQLAGGEKRSFARPF